MIYLVFLSSSVARITFNDFVGPVSCISANNPVTIRRFAYFFTAFAERICGFTSILHPDGNSPTYIDCRTVRSSLGFGSRDKLSHLSFPARFCESFHQTRLQGEGEGEEERPWQLVCVNKLVQNDESCSKNAEIL